MSLLPKLSFNPGPPPHQQAQGNREWGLWSAHYALSLMLLPHTLLLLHLGAPLTGDSSSWTSPTWVIPTDSSSLWTVSVWLPSMGSTSGSYILPENLLLHGLLFMGCSSWWNPDPEWALQGFTAPCYQNLPIKTQYTQRAFYFSHSTHISWPICLTALALIISFIPWMMKGARKK